MLIISNICLFFFRCVYTFLNEIQLNHFCRLHIFFKYWTSQHFFSLDKELNSSRHILDSSELKEFADDNFKCNENGSKFSKKVQNILGKQKLLVTSNFSFSHSVLKSLVLQTRKNQSLLWKGLNSLPNSRPLDWT